MQVSVAKILFAMGRDRQLPRWLAITHPRYQTPWVAMSCATAISVVVACVLRNRVYELTSLVNFGALCGFIILHISVIILFAVRRKSRKILHIGTPVVGIVVVLGILSGMDALALKIGSVWAILGLSYALYLKRAAPERLETDPLPA